MSTPSITNICTQFNIFSNIVNHSVLFKSCYSFCDLYNRLLHITIKYTHYFPRDLHYTAIQTGMLI